MNTALVILSPGFEETEAITVIDILRRAGIDVTTASLEENAAVVGSHHITIMADRTLSEIDVLRGAIVLPGGMRGVENMLASPAVLDIVSRHAEAGAVLAAVCAAPLVLDKLGLLTGHRFTCHPVARDRMSAPATEARAVTDANIVTGRSAGCALPWSLELVRRMLGDCSEALLKGLAV